MAKVQHISGITKRLPFEDLDFYDLFRITFENSELGRMKCTCMSFEYWGMHGYSFFIEMFFFFLFILDVGLFIWGLVTHNHFINNVFSVVHGGVLLVSMYAIIIGLLVGVGYLIYLLVR